MRTPNLGEQNLQLNYPLNTTQTHTQTLIYTKETQYNTQVVSTFSTRQSIKVKKWHLFEGLKKIFAILIPQFSPNFYVLAASNTEENITHNTIMRQQKKTRKRVCKK